jgi:hypothetical protein
MKKFQIAQVNHQSELGPRLARSQAKIATARTAKAFVEKNPRFARWSVVAVLRLTAAIQRSRAKTEFHGEPEGWDLVPTFDIWGIPISPRPKTP